MRPKKRLSIKIFAILLLLCSCSTVKSNSNQENTGEAAQTDTESETEIVFLKDSLPDGINFNGQEFNMLSPDDYGGQILVDEEVGEILNDTQYKTERDVEERLNVAITETLSPFWDMTTAVQKLVASGDSTYECITMMDRFAFSAAQNKCFIPIQKLDYIDLSQKYWGGNLSDQLTIGKKSFFAISSFSLKSFVDTACIMINTDLASDFSIAIPYGDVDDGTWTFEKMTALGKPVISDLNGDSIMDTQDRYAVGAVDRRALSAIFWIGSGEHVLQKDADDNIYAAVNGSEKFINVLEKIHTLFFTGSDSLITDADTFDTNDIFKAGQELIHVSYFNYITNCRDMKDNFTILPIPKYDESQENYISRTFDSMFTMAPVTVEDKSFTGAVLEAFSCAGYNYIIPAYIKTSLQDKYSRDAESVKSIEIAFDSRSIDLGEAFMSDYYGDGVMYKLMMSSTFNVATYIEKNTKVVDRNIQLLNKMVED